LTLAPELVTAYHWTRRFLPCEQAPSVTVVGPDVTSAGLWATTLCVLGLEGLKRMPPNARLEALMVVGDSPEDSRW
jgi:thiamine biosynthesis lipoprotein ApbE